MHDSQVLTSAVDATKYKTDKRIIHLCV